MFEFSIRESLLTFDPGSLDRSVSLSSGIRTLASRYG